MLVLSGGDPDLLRRHHDLCMGDDNDALRHLSTEIIQARFLASA